MAERLPESRDVSGRVLVVFAGGFVLFVLAALAVLAIIFDTTALWPPGGRAAIPNQSTPALQRTPKADLAAFRDRETEELRKLQWVDRSAGIARIPIEDAMRLVADRGLPEFPGEADVADRTCPGPSVRPPRAPDVPPCPPPAAEEEATR